MSEFATNNDNGWFNTETSTLATKYVNGTPVKHYAGDQTANGVANLEPITTPEDVRMAIEGGNVFLTLADGSPVYYKALLTSPTSKDLKAKAEQDLQDGLKATAEREAAEFVSSPDGGLDFGEITPEMGKAMRRQAGKIRLTQGEQNPDGTGHGLVHIEANHGVQIRKAGFKSVQDFVAHVAGGFNEILQAAKGRQLLVAVTDGRRDVMFVQLEASDDGDFYKVNTAFPASRDYLEKQEGKGAKVLWGGSEPRPVAAGKQPLYAGSPEKSTGQDAPIAQSQSDSSVPAQSDAGKPAKIEDSGEVLEGARKLYAKNYAAKLDEAREAHKAVLALLKKKDDLAEGDEETEAPVLSRIPTNQQDVEQWQQSLRSAATNPQAKEPNMVTPMVLKMIGAKAVRLVLPRKYLTAIIKKHPDVPLSVFENLPEMLADPMFIIPYKDGGLRVFVQAETNKGEPIAVGVSVDKNGRIQTVTPFNDANEKGSGVRRRDYQVAQAFARGEKIYAINSEALATARASSAAAPGLLPLHRLPVRSAIVVTRKDVVNRLESSNGNSGPNYSRRQASNGMTNDDLSAGEQPAGISKAALATMVSKVKAKMPNMPKVHEMYDPSEAPEELKQYIIEQNAWHTVEGAMHKGEFYMFRANLRSVERAEHVLAEHEVAHFGLRAILGRNRDVERMMNYLWVNNPSIRARAAQLQSFGKLSQADAVEEVIVDIPTSELVKLKGWRKIVLKVRDWLSANGFENLARRLTEWLNGNLDDQERADLLVAELVGGARDYVRGKRKAWWQPGASDYIGVTKLSSLLDELRVKENWMLGEAKARGFKSVEEMAAKNLKAFENLNKVWDKRIAKKEMQALAEKRAAAKLSRSVDTKAAYEARIDALFDGAAANRVGVKVLDRSDVLDLLGFGTKPMVLQESKVLAGRDNHPNMTAEVWKKVPQWLENPAAVFDSDTEPGSLVFVAPEAVSGLPAVMIVKPNPTAGGAALSVSLLVNAYGKDGGMPAERWMRDGLLRYADKKAFPGIFALSVGRQLPDTALQNKPGTRSILTERNLAGYRKQQDLQKEVAPAISQSEGVQFPKHNDISTGRKPILSEKNLNEYRKANFESSGSGSRSQETKLSIDESGNAEPVRNRILETGS